jgi:adenine-specific DNA methylase
MATASQQKVTGAFYTPPRVAELLILWGVREPSDFVLDPSFGEGVFLDAAMLRLAKLRGKPNRQIFGIELDESAVARASSFLNRRHFILNDFFAVSPSELPSFDVVVGNPPFVRYHHFTGTTRQKAIALSRRAGVEISELTSSWAPFLVHATQFLRRDGRLAMVVPFEITHAAYARPVLQHLTRCFRHVYMAAFEQRIFPGLSQDTVLLLADGFGTECPEIRFKRFRNVEEFAELAETHISFGKRVGVAVLEKSNGRLRNHLLTGTAGALYNSLSADSRTQRLGSMASVGIGYVTGCNDFFHLSQHEISQLRIPMQYLQPSLVTPKALSGLQFTKADWRQFQESGAKAFLLDLAGASVREHELPPSVCSYVEAGRRKKIHLAYKCMVRKPWYAVPHAQPANAFLSYMTGTAPKVCWNAAQVLATNSTYEVRFPRTSSLAAWKLAFAFSSSLVQLSCEIEGHPMGGGMLKLEPSEAEMVILPRLELLSLNQAEFEKADQLMRAGSDVLFYDLVDQVVLRQALRLTSKQIHVLRDALGHLRQGRRKQTQ